jgi:hypothetical protein
MMHGREKSDPEIVAMKPTNNAVPPAAELVERRAGTKGNADQQSTLRAQDRVGVSQALERIRQAARHNKKERFTTLLHHVSVETLFLAFHALKKDAAPGADGVVWSDYEADLDLRLEELHDRVHRGAYRPQPSRRVYIPKADGRQRPLAIAAVEDKIVQGAVAMVLSVIYEGRVEERRSGLGRMASPCFPSPLIKPDVPISGIRLSDWLHFAAIGGAPMCIRRSRSTPSFS